MENVKQRRLGLGRVVWVAALTGTLAYLLHLIGGNWVGYAGLVGSAAMLLAGSWFGRTWLTVLGSIGLALSFATPAAIDFIQWQNNPTAQAEIVAKEKREQVQEQVKAKIKADLAAEGVVIGPQSYYKINYNQGRIDVADTLDAARIELRVNYQGKDSVTTFPVRLNNGVWQLGCEFTTTQGHKVWLSWRERVPGSTTLLVEFVSEYGSCPVGMGPITLG